MPLLSHIFAFFPPSHPIPVPGLLSHKDSALRGLPSPHSLPPTSTPTLLDASAPPSFLTPTVTSDHLFLYGSQHSSVSARLWPFPSLSLHFSLALLSHKGSALSVLSNVSCHHLPIFSPVYHTGMMYLQPQPLTIQMWNQFCTTPSPSTFPAWLDKSSALHVFLPCPTFTPLPHRISFPPPLPLAPLYPRLAQP